MPYGPTKTPYGQKAATQMVTFTGDFRYLESWVLPKVILDKFESLSNSGGSWGPDGHLYLSGRDPAKLYKMRLPKAGSVLELVEVIAMNIRGRGIAWDRSDRGVIQSWPRGAVGSGGLAGWPTDGSARPKKDECRHLTSLRSRYEIT